jgi:hypothetical protein
MQDIKKPKRKKQIDIRNILKEFKKQLKVIYKDNLKGVILFGSYARGDYDSESDIDTLVLLNEVQNYDTEFDRVLFVEQEIQEKYDYKFIINSIIATYNNYNFRLNPLYLNVKREGIPI